MQSQEKINLHLIDMFYKSLMSNYWESSNRSSDYDQTLDGRRLNRYVLRGYDHPENR